MADDLSEYAEWRTDPLAVLDAAVASLDGEDRPGQRMLASAVADAIRHGHHLVAEAPTGSGKSLAYLSPVVASGLRVVIATSTIALQDQLIGKDVPQLRKASGVPFSAVTLKGRANYICRAKLATVHDPERLFDLAPGANFDADVASVRSLAERSFTGDRSELPEDVPDASWAAVSCSGQECPGARECDDGPQCFAERARALAADADVIIVNHALACLDLGADGNVLPDHDLLVVDEAHALAEAATPVEGVATYTQAVMDLGATVCTPRSPRCVICPLMKTCKARKEGIAEELPARAPKAQKPTRRGLAFVLANRDGAILLRKRPAKGLLGGMDEVPSSPWREGKLVIADALNEAPVPARWKVLEGGVRHTFTHFHLELAVARATATTSRLAKLAPGSAWVEIDKLDERALPTVMRKVIAHAIKA